MQMLTNLAHALLHARPFGIAASESLMQFSPLGSLQCHCEPTDAAEDHNDRRRSCRACGHPILAVEPARLYEHLSPSDIRSLTGRLRRAGIEARPAAWMNQLSDLTENDMAETPLEFGTLSN